MLNEALVTILEFKFQNQNTTRSELFVTVVFTLSLIPINIKQNLKLWSCYGY